MALECSALRPRSAVIRGARSRSEVDHEVGRGQLQRDHARVRRAHLIYGAFNPTARPLILTVAGLSKVTFAGLVLAFGSQYLGGQAGLAIMVDLVMVALFVSYLIGVRRGRPNGWGDR